MDAIAFCNGGFQNLSLQKWSSPISVIQRGGLKVVQKRAQIPQAGYGNSSGYKDVYRRRDNADNYDAARAVRGDYRPPEMASSKGERVAMIVKALP